MQWLNKQVDSDIENFRNDFAKNQKDKLMPGCYSEK